MRKRGTLLVLGLIVIVSGWWIVRNGALAQPSEGVVDVWATWGDEPGQLQAFFDRFSEANDVSVRVTTRVRDDDLLEALAGSQAPDLVILSGNDLVASYDEQGLVESLDGWIEVSGIDLEDIYPAPLAQCQGPDGATLCLPWGCDVDALFWNKDLFAAAGLDPERPPQTMEELVEYAGRLTLRDEEGELVQVGFVPDLPRSHADLYVRMFGGAFSSDGGAEMTVNREPVIDALAWEQRFYSSYGPEELTHLISPFTPYMRSRHPMYGGRRMSCQQCHRSSAIRNNKTPDTGFYEGRIAMMIDGQWQVGLSALSHEGAQVNYGVAPFPPRAAHPERAKTAVVRGPVVIVPAGAKDKEAAVYLLAWMTSPEILAEAADAHSLLPTSRMAAQDPGFQQIANLTVFVELMAHPNAKPAVPSPISPELNEALGRVEMELLDGGGDPALLLNEVQTELAPRLEEALSYQGRP